MVELREEIRQWARESGADLVGFASLERFAEVAPEHHPASIFPGAKTVIVIGRRILRGSLRAMEEGTNLQDYPMYGNSWLNMEFIPATVYRTVQFIEDRGWEAVPLYPYPTNIEPEGVQTAPDRPAPNVTIDFDLAAVAAGLGEIGLSGTFLSPQYGPRQRFGIILTDADLGADPICADKVCLQCRSCIEVCPAAALTPGNQARIAGRTFDTCYVDNKSCEACKNGAASNTFHQRGTRDRLGSLCTRTCIHQLEKSGRTSGAGFGVPLRSREPWVIESAVERVRKGGA